MKNIFTLIITIIPSILLAQDTGGYNKDLRSGCKVWSKFPDYMDSVAWKGNCVNGIAEGFGEINWYYNGAEVDRYIGFVKAGKRVGAGKHISASGSVLEGNFVDDEFLNLGEAYLKRLSKNTIPISDEKDIYVTDGNSKSLFYHMLLPANDIQGVIILLPGAWETTEHVMSNTKTLCESASDNQLAVIVPSVNQHIVLTAENLIFLNAAFKDAIEKYKLPKDKFIIGGFSMGGHLATRYTEMAMEDPTKTTIVPKAIFNVDGSIDVENLYQKWKEDLVNERNKNKGEPEYAIHELKSIIGGSPEKFHTGYVHYSVYSTSEKNGGNAQFLKNTPIRIYNDIDVNWWITNRGIDLYGMNALDQSAMINYLNGIGNTKAEFINTIGKGYRLEGNRHPHSWSIVDADDCIKWILHCLT